MRDDTTDFLRWLGHRVYNIRALYSAGPSKNYWTTDAEEAADIALGYSADEAKGVYCNLHHIKTEHTKIAGEQSFGVNSEFVTGVSTLLIDIDVDDTCYRKVANDAALKVADHFLKYGWPQPWVMDSGNGAACLWRIDLPVDTKLPERVGKYVGELDLPQGLKVDEGIYDLARVYKIPGTISRKYTPVPAKTLVHGSDALLTVEQLEALVGHDDTLDGTLSLPPLPNSIRTSVAMNSDISDLIQNVTEYLRDCGADVQGTDGNKIVFGTCPNKGQKTATPGGAVVYVNDDRSIVSTTAARESLGVICRGNSVDYSKLPVVS